jgi:hypothetical protein
VTAISNEGGHVKYHVNEPGNGATKKQNGGQHQQQQQQQVFMTTTTESNHIKTKQAVHNSSVELPLSILNATSINNQGQVSLRINPLISVKSNQASSSVTSDYTSEFMSSRRNEDDLSTDEFTDFNDNPSENSAKNSQLLEKYKQMKRSQLERDNTNQSKISLESKSSSHSIPSPKKNFSDLGKSERF